MNEEGRKGGGGNRESAFNPLHCIYRRHYFTVDTDRQGEKVKERSPLQTLGAHIESLRGAKQPCTMLPLHSTSLCGSAGRSKLHATTAPDNNPLLQKLGY